MFTVPSLPTLLPSATIVPESSDIRAGFITLQDTTTGAQVSISERAYMEKNENTLRQRIRSSEPTSSKSQIITDWSRRTYRLTEYPPMTYRITRYWAWYIPFGILLIAACAQIRFLFPCTIGYSEITVGSHSYCVDNERVGEITNTTCPAHICSKRIPVTMQTFAVLLNGALAGSRIGALTSFFYLVLVCLGAPFSSGGMVDPVWNKGAILSSTGGFLWGFIVASYIMGKCTEKGHDRHRSILRLILWMLAAEGAMYCFGLSWLPFGLAIKADKSPSAICPSEAGAAACLKNIFTWGFIPFIPGDFFKMFLVLCVLPLSWQLINWYHKRSNGYRNVYTAEYSSDGMNNDLEIPDAAPEGSENRNGLNVASSGGKDGEKVNSIRQIPEYVA